MKLPNGYDLAYLTIFPVAAAAVKYRMARHGKYRESAPLLLGRDLSTAAAAEEQRTLWKNGSIWVHAVSVGEVGAARAMLPLLRERFPELPILLTTHTETGQAAARALPAGLTDAVRYFPVDFSWLMQRAVSVYQPRIFIPMETELWPNALDIISSSGAKIFTLNGKISERSFRSYQRIRALIRRPLSRITAFCAQTAADANRISALTGRTDNVHVTGNCKFDIEIPLLDCEAKADLAAELGLPWPTQLVVAGSTHKGEELITINSFQTILAAHPECHLALVPRHPERFSEVWSDLLSADVNAVRVSDQARTQPENSAQPNVHLVDRMGVLTRLYGLADVAIVAGSFVSGIGGHNLLEPAAHGVPVVYGPDMKGQPDMLRIMRDSGAGTQVAPGELAKVVDQLLSNPELARQKGIAGQNAYRANRGSARRNMEVLELYLGKEFPKKAGDGS